MKIMYAGSLLFVGGLPFWGSEQEFLGKSCDQIQTLEKLEKVWKNRQIFFGRRFSYNKINKTQERRETYEIEEADYETAK